MPPPNMPFWHKDYFELKATEKKQIQEKLSALLLFGHKFAEVEGQKLITGDSSGHLPVQRWQQRKLHDKPC